MGKTKIFIALLLCAALLLSMCGCGATTPSPTEPTPTEPPVTEPPVSLLYTEAAQPLRDAENLSIELDIKKTITTQTNTMVLRSEQELVLSGIGTDTFTASLNEEVDMGDVEDRFTEYYADGKLFVNVYDAGHFQGEMAAEDFMARFAPAALLDESLYENVSADQTDSGTTMTFADPIGPESWALPEGAEFISGSGSAKIDPNGSLTRTGYTICYRQGNTEVTAEISAKAEMYNDEVPEAPEEPEKYVQIDDINVPRLYDTATWFLFGSNTASAKIAYTIASEAAGAVLNSQTQMHYSGGGENHVSDITSAITLTDINLNTQSRSWTDHFQDGVYTYTEDGAEPQTDESITARDMQNYILDQYVDILPALEYIESASSEDMNGLIYLQIGLNEVWGEGMENYASYTLFQDENLLDSYATAYKTTECSYYLVIDPATGFPISSGTSYGGVHTIDGQDCALSLEMTQSFRLAEPNTYEQITGEMLPEEEPQEKATPLLYRVTGENGQQMYLMGTIHAGDSRTAYLPEEVYTAFEESDALAVEANVIAFEEQVEQDPQLAAQIAALYMNQDGKSIEELLDPELYAHAVKLIKASGNYVAGAEYMTPYIWSNMIDQFFVSLSGIRAEQGVDLRLIKLAEEQEKKILEVESSMQQIEMFANFSRELQLLILEENLDYTVAEYSSELQELYEMWCAGDEAALRKMLAEEDDEMTAEELALYQEYVDKVIIQRNEGMLEVAVEYLESGETVFYAVGLAHLLQENGLVDTLQTAGYTVEQVSYS